jgi:hypothetical protein
VGHPTRIIVSINAGEVVRRLFETNYASVGGRPNHQYIEKNRVPVLANIISFVGPPVDTPVRSSESVAGVMVFRPDGTSAHVPQLVARRQDLQQRVAAGFQSGQGQTYQGNQPTDHAAEDFGKWLGSPPFSDGMGFLPTTGRRVVDRSRTEAALQDAGTDQVIADRPEAMKAQFKARLFLGRSEARA